MFLFNKNKTYEKIDLKHKFLVQKIKKSDDKAVLILKDNKLKARCIYYINNKFDTRIDKVREGFTIKINAKKSNLVNNTVLNNFNYKQYLRSKKIYNACIIKNFNIVNSRENIFYKVKNFIKKRINKSNNLDYMHTFILGDTSFLDEDIVNKYRSNGLSHLFAISGMHINFFALFLLGFFKKIRLEEEKAYFLVVIVIWFYSFLTGFSGSVIRASIFFTILTLNKVFMLEIKTINALFLTLFVVMIYNPNILYDISFLYSFLSTLGLIYGLKNGLFLSSVYAQVFTIPVSIANFHTVNFITIFINPLFSWFVSSIIYPLTLLTFFIFNLGYILSFLIKILEGLNSFFYNISIFKIEFRSLNIPFIIIYYCIVLLFINKSFKKCILLITILLVFSNLTLNFDNNYYVDFIDVNQGDSTLIRHRKSVYIIDTGGIIGSFNSDFKVSDRTINYLKSLGINKIKALILTHGDFDHMGEAINLVNNFKVEKVIFNCGPYNDLESKLIKVLDNKKIKYYSCINELNIDNNKLYFLQTKEYDNENDNSNVIYTELDGYKFMFMGDAGVTTEKEILSIYNLPDIDVLKVGHHGSKTSSSKDFINEINPEYSIISVGKNNRYGHPNKEVLENLENSKIYRTDTDGSIMFKIKNNKLKIENCRP